MKNLMIVDMQKGFINKYNEFLVDKINNFLKCLQISNIYLTKYKNTQQSLYTKLLDYTKMRTQEEQQFVVKCEKAKIFEKQTYGLTEEHIKELKKDEVSEIYLCGTDLGACVLAIAYNLFDAGIKPIFIKELCGSSSRNSQVLPASWTLIERNFGKKCICSEKDLQEFQHNQIFVE